MKELEEFLEKELRFLAQKKDDWGHLTIEDDSRERTLLEVREVVKKLPIHNVVEQSEQLSCDTCKLNCDTWDDNHPCASCCEFDNYQAT